MPSNARPNPTISHFEQLRYAQEIIQIESHALANLAKRLDADFCHAVDLLFRCNGSVIVTGMGKAGLIAQKVAATLSSTGTQIRSSSGIALGITSSGGDSGGCAPR